MGVADSIQEAKLESCKVVRNMSSPEHHWAFVPHCLSLALPIVKRIQIGVGFEH
jgi:hypothetical protein